MRTTRWWIDHFWQVYVGFGALVGGVAFYLLYRSLRDDDGDVELEPEELRELILDNRAVQMAVYLLCVMWWPVLAACIRVEVKRRGGPTTPQE